MNKIETVVYGVVRQHPGLKKFLKSTYQGFFDLLPRKKEFFSGNISYKEGYFFGFHDISPLSNDETKLLTNKFEFDGRMPKSDEKLTLGYFDFNDGTLGDFHKIATTTAWNWHKGCRFQWLDNKRVIFNSVVGGQLCASIADTEGNFLSQTDFPIDSVFIAQDKELATSFCYERLNKCMPGYGYAVADGDSDENYPRDSGLFIIDLKTNIRKCVVSLYDLANNIGNKYLKGYKHFVTHSEFSKDGKYISFLYRAVPYGEEGKDMHKTWIVVHNLLTSDTQALPTQESGSHYVWNNKGQIVASCTLDKKNCHAIFDVKNNCLVKTVASDSINSDGHQSFVTDEIFVTDTYPDRSRMARIYSVDVNNDGVKLLANVYSPKEFQTKDVYCHIACDLHPRVLASGKYICFDSPRTGRRGIYIMSMPKL
mgnify:CR=1 FL=1